MSERNFLVMDEFWQAIKVSDADKKIAPPTARITLNAVQSIENGLVLDKESKNKLSEFQDEFSKLGNLINSK